MAPEDPQARGFRLGLATFVGFAGIMHFARRVARDAARFADTAPTHS